MDEEQPDYFIMAPYAVFDMQMTTTIFTAIAAEYPGIKKKGRGILCCMPLPFTGWVYKERETPFSRSLICYSAMVQSLPLQTTLPTR
ncbi:MAG: hypothetical protein NTY00_11320 [Deltaproteobacteria bacterium]|nr:hypothetical protein [Deltaproteobacteria bacterium]